MRAAREIAIEQAFTKGAILRTHLLSPTWHFVIPADIRWLPALTAPRIHTRNAHMNRKLDIAALKRSDVVLADTLSGGQPLRCDELRQALLKAGIAANETLQLAYILMHPELEG